MELVLVKSFGSSYGFGYDSLLNMVCISSTQTAQFLFRSSCSFSSFKTILPRPLFKEENEIKLCEKGTPIFLSTVLSVKSL